MQRYIFTLMACCLVSCNQNVYAQNRPSAPHYTVTNLGSLPLPQFNGLFDDVNHDARETEAYGINDHGQIVGGSNGDAFLWQNGQMHPLGIYEGPTDESENPITATALAINKYGLIVGYTDAHNRYGDLSSRSGFTCCGGKKMFEGFGDIAYSVNSRGEIVGSGGFRGFYYSHTGTYDLETVSKRPSGNGSIAVAINDKGQFVGATTVDAPKGAELPLHAFLWIGSKKNGRMKDLGTLTNFPYSIATAINNQSEVVGYAGQSGWGRGCRVSGVTHAFLWRKGKMTDLGLLTGTNSSQADGINNSGQIVGKSGSQAVLWCGGKPYDLNTLLEAPVNSPLVEATAINNLGQIVCYNGTGAYLLTPIKRSVGQ